ncbi:hypothetical protein N8T08_009496 [Aspergillus melleus]|uniref:Uncharacterized protein n=1 Tax=Aspergillus melleus TaxID=138277 RepID=A0ACC3BDV4_9EURO|nr:hypothetical protein N8T08_009496 [Aspergillus melleus]
MNAFVQQSRGGAWHLAGLASSFPDIQSQDDCSLIKPHCKAFSIPKTNNGPSTDDKAPIPANLDRPGRELKDQVLVFKFKGKFHAIDHHDWSFDLFSGQGDRGNYKLKVWEVQLRDPSATDGAHEPDDQEVWTIARH